MPLQKWLGLSAGAKSPFVSYLAAAGARSGLDQIVADEKRSSSPSTWTSQRAPA
jgi:hypothetical protein